MGWDDGLPDARPRHPVWIDALRARPHARDQRRVRRVPPDAPARRAAALLDGSAILGSRAAGRGRDLDGRRRVLRLALAERCAARTGSPARRSGSARPEAASTPPAIPGATSRRSAGSATGAGPLPAPPRVGREPANGFGLTDLAGVVHEWCLDWYAADAYRPEPARAPIGSPRRLAPRVARRRLAAPGALEPGGAPLELAAPPPLLGLRLPRRARAARRLGQPPDRLVEERPAPGPSRRARGRCGRPRCPCPSPRRSSPWRRAAPSRAGGVMSKHRPFAKSFRSSLQP